MKDWIFSCCFMLISLAIPHCGSQVSDETYSLKRQVEKLFSPETTVLDAKVLVDAMIDPLSRSSDNLVLIDKMAIKVALMAGNNADDDGKLASLRRYLYEPGEWNGFARFEYDSSDPLGENPRSRHLERYLRTRRGNCITMPILLLAIGQRLGLNITLAEAPLHVFLKFTDRHGKVWNLEATSGGGFTREIWYRRNLRMSDQAVSNGVYLRALSREESIALIASFLVEDRLAKRDFEGAITISEILLRHYPNFAYLLVKMGSAYTGLLRQELTLARRGKVNTEKLNYWSAMSSDLFGRAEALGWTVHDGPISEIIETPKSISR